MSNRNARLEFLAVMHTVYADNEVVTVEDAKGHKRKLYFEPRDYHLGMARMYRSWKI